MKRFLALTVLALCPMAASADSLDLGPYGVFGVTPPKGWRLSSQKVAESGYTVTLSPAGDANAKCIINVTFVPDPQPVSKEKVQEEVLDVGEQFVDQSVEKKKVLRDLNAAGGVYGCYCVFTDASMVGQPSKKDEFKVIGVGVVQYDDKVMAAFSVAADDEKGSDFASMLAAVSGTTLKPKK